MGDTKTNVCSGPQATLLALFDDLIGASMKRSGNIDVLTPRRLKIDYQLKGCWLHDWQLHRVSTIENFSSIDARLAIRIPDVRAVTHKATHLHKLSERVDGRKRQLPSPCNNCRPLSDVKRVPTD